MPVCLALLVATGALGAGAQTPAEADSLSRAGSYDEARRILEEIGEGPAPRQ